MKQFQGTTHLATSTSTSFTKVDQEVETLSGPALLENSEVQLQVKEFKSVNKLSIFTSCQSCKRKITEISQKYIKCQNCGVRQRVENCKRDASVQLLVNLPGDEEIWLTAFTDVIMSLLMVGSASLLSDSDTIEEHLLDINNISFTYNVNKKVITSIATIHL